MRSLTYSLDNSAGDGAHASTNAASEEWRGDVGGADRAPENRVEQGEIVEHICGLRLELARVTEACAAVQEQGEPGRLFFLLRKKWQLMQQLFEAENQLRLLR